MTSAGGAVPAGDWTRAIFGLGYGILTIFAGWGYVIREKIILGWLHSFLMLGIAVVVGYIGFGIVTDRSVAGGTGPDANPVAGIVYGLGAVYCIVSLVTCVCGAGVLVSLTERTK